MPPRRALGILLGVIAGPIVSFAAGFIAYVIVTRMANHGGGTPQWLPLATYIAIQLLPVVLAIALGTQSLRTRRTQVGWFLVVTGIMAFAPAAACDTALLVGVSHFPNH